VFVYPGPAPELQAHAHEFQAWKGRQWPADFTFALDPDYAMVQAYGLRWDKAGETAYPSTFVIDTTGVVRHVKVSRSHGDRTKAAEVLKQIAETGTR
jgi:peroxiredoxin